MRHIITQPKDLIGHWVQAKLDEEYGWHGYSTIGYYDDQKERLVAAAVIDRLVTNDEDGYHDCSIHVAGEGFWATKTFLNAVFDYVFNQLGCVRCTGLVEAVNEKARLFDEHIGFTKEAIIRKGRPSGDLIVYRMFKEDCRWIQPEYLNGRSR